ncbi:MAG: hypothetical protein Q8L48_17925 [Archangium sp.]|nr:hypothetical protein [Archangium sp.]
MRQSLVGVVFFLSAAGCGPSAGAPCTASDTVTCKSSTEAYACIQGTWAVAPCAGPKGCTDTSAFNCDLTLASANTPCPPWAEGRSACQGLPPALVSCFSGKWQQTSVCNSCSVASGAPECLTNGTGGGGGGTGGGGGGATGGGGGVTGGGGGVTGGGGGVTGGGGGTTGGGGGTTGGGGGSAACGPGTCAGCCSNGQCFTAPLNGSSNFCGNNGAACDDCGARGQRCDSGTLRCVASTSCNPTSCPTGCCTNGQCFTAPLNATANFCGTGGAACSDCARLGLICSAATFTCNPAGTGGGGGATGGGGGAVTGGGGGAVTGGGGGTVDPCQGVPVGGQCVTGTLVRYCSIPTGSGTPSVQTYACPGGTSCQATGAGAACIQTGTCRQDDTRCASATTIQQCSASGTWGAAQSCGGGGCVGSSVGANCIISTPTTALTATLLYQSRSPRADLTDWGLPVAVPARNVLVLSLRGQQWIDATTTNAAGQYTIKVPTTPTANDLVLFAAFGGDGLGMRYVVGDPGLGTGTFSPGQQGQNIRYWSWSKAISSLANGGTTTITTAEGSGALNMYDLLQNIWASSIANNQGRPGMTLSMWMGFGTEWSCGACFSESGGDFETSIWMPGGSQDEGYWSDYTIAHELGHWQMRSYGTSPNEGGPHTLTCPTFPGQAWSEGYATWHSAAVRNEPTLEDKQQGGFFWFDIGSRTYFPQSTSAMPINGPGGTNLQAQIDENAVSAMLWYISNSRQTGAEEIFNAVSSAHMNTTPWPRGYTRRTWDVGSGCNKTNVVNTNQPSLHVADMLDALSCGGSPAQSNRMPAATILQSCSAPTSSGNGAYYPYPSTAPSCRAGFCYGCKTGTTCNAGNVASACGTGGVQCVACGGGQSCVNGVCL